VTLPDASALPAVVAAKPSEGVVTFDDMVKGWARDNGHDPDAKPIPRPYYDRFRTIQRLGIFLGHNEARRVVQADAVRWKESLQGAGKAAATVANDVSEMFGDMAVGRP